MGFQARTIDRGQKLSFSKRKTRERRDFFEKKNESFFKLRGEKIDFEKKRQTKTLVRKRYFFSAKKGGGEDVFWEIFCKSPVYVPGKYCDRDCEGWKK